VARYAVFLVLALTTGCSAWISIGRETPAQYIARTKPVRVRLWVADSTIVLNRPLVSGDSIVGAAEVPSTEKQVGVEASRVRKLQIPGKRGVSWIMFGGFTVAVLISAYIALHKPQ